jgi:hypothetical protein
MILLPRIAKSVKKALNDQGNMRVVDVAMDLNPRMALIH